MQDVTLTPSRRTLEFGIYRDGDNNLDAVQESVLSQALQTSRTDPHLQFTVQDTTGLRVRGDEIGEGKVHTEQYTIQDGSVAGATSGKAHDMSDPTNLAQFVAKTLDNAQASGAKQTWIDLVDHGGGDGGGLQTHDGSVMTMPDIAKAIADGVALHAREHPEDAGRGVDGVVANQCLMDTMGFADALSHAGVKYLAASPETMIAPGAPTNVAHDIAKNEGDPNAMARGVVRDVMDTRYDPGIGERYAGAAAFDVLDLDPAKIARAEAAIKHLNDDAASTANDPNVRAALRDDARSVDGMARIPDAKGLPWRADRSAIGFYDAVAGDARVGAGVRADAADAATAVGDLVLAHRESRGFAPFAGSDYSDAVGPTVHLPTSHGQIDPWAKAGISETDNAFYRNVDEPKMTRVLA